MSPQESHEARDTILRSIRTHLAASLSHNERELASQDISVTTNVASLATSGNGESVSLVEMFKESLEAVDGHCVVVHNEMEAVRALTKIIVDLQDTKLKVHRIALSDQPAIEHLVRLVAIEVDEVAVSPGAADLFQFDVGITGVQAAIAETGTIVLDSDCERHRLVSLVPPVHIALVDASRLYQTLGETLALLHHDDEDVSSTITFVTGPSRTADIELTLALGVHGPQELFVIVNDGPPLLS